MTADCPLDFPYEEVPEETRPEVLRRYWSIAEGLQAVDGLEPSGRLKELSLDNINGVRSLFETGNLLQAYYENIEENVVDSDIDSTIRSTREADFVSLRITELLAKGAFLFAPEMLGRIHAYLFQDLDSETYKPGEYKSQALLKQEFILNGDSVVYADPSLIEASLKTAFEDEMSYSYGVAFDGAAIENLAKFISRLWQVHPFVEGNTRTVAVFTVLYLNDLGFDVTNEPFESYSTYFRNALVRAIYRNPKAKVIPDKSYLEKFLTRAVDGLNDSLKSRELIVEELFEDPSLLRNVSAEKALQK